MRNDQYINVRRRWLCGRLLPQRSSFCSTVNNLRLYCRCLCIFVSWPGDYCCRVEKYPKRPHFREYRLLLFFTCTLNAQFNVMPSKYANFLCKRSSVAFWCSEGPRHHYFAFAKYKSLSRSECIRDALLHHNRREPAASPVLNRVWKKETASPSSIKIVYRMLCIVCCVSYVVKSPNPPANVAKPLLKVRPKPRCANITQHTP